MVEVSRSPNTVSATVRGIGVAVITSRCGVSPAPGALARRAVSLFDAEPVLFVDHHQSEVVELHGVLQQGVGADHDAGRTGCHLVADLFLLRRRHRPGEQGDPGRVVGAAELTGHRQRAQHVADRPGMLCGKDFGGRQQGTDSRRRPSASSPAPRRWSCRSPPRPAAGGSSACWRPAPARSPRAPRAARRSSSNGN